MRILYLAHRIPYPPNKGDKIRSFNEIKYLSRKHEIHLACLADNPADLKYTADLEEYCAAVHVERLVPSLAKVKGAMSMLRGRPFSVGYFHSIALQQVVDRWIEGNRYDAVICFSSPMAEYPFRSPALSHRFPRRNPVSLSPQAQRSLSAAVLDPSAPGQRPRLIMDFCDLDSDKWRQYAGESAVPAKLIYWLESRLLLSYEKRVNRLFDYSVFVSEPEANLFLRLDPGAKNARVISNGVDHVYFSPRSDEASSAAVLKPPASGSKTPVLLFTGAMDYHANIDGVVWFCNDIFPLIRRAMPSAEFYIVGSNPTPEVKKLAEKPGVTVTGFVEDIRPYYRAADVCVIPLRLARGIQNKVLEAMSMAKAVVTTGKALEGIGATPGEHLLIANDVIRFSENVEGLLKGEAQRCLLGSNARRFITTQCNWGKNMERLGALLETSHDKADNTFPM